MGGVVPQTSDAIVQRSEKVQPAGISVSDRPIVIPATGITVIQLGDDDEDNAIVSCDGEVTGRVGSGDRLRVAVSDMRVELIHPIGYDYFGILRSKLHWGRGNRTTNR